MTPRYPIVRIEVASEGAEDLGVALFESGASGIEEHDETTIERPAPGRTRLVAHFDEEADARSAAEAFGGELGFIEGDDWRDAWKAFFKPTRVGQRLVIRPTWESWTRAPDDVVIVVDPGQAFGTGTHESTQLVLAEIETRTAPGATVLDVGCGSGILAIAACLLGAADAVCVDIDPIAVRTTLENAEQNGVKVSASTTAIEKVEGRFDLVLANIQHHILVPMREALASKLNPGGVLVLSGLLAVDEAATREAFDERLAFAGRRAAGEWVALVYRAAST